MDYLFIHLSIYILPNFIHCLVSFQLHLFDINIPGKITFEESKTLTPGKNLTTVDIGESKLLKLPHRFYKYFLLELSISNLHLYVALEASWIVYGLFMVSKPVWGQ